MPAIGRVIGWILEKIAKKLLVIGIQISASTALILAHAALLGFFLYAILFVYNKYNDLLNNINNMTTQSDLLGVALHVMQAIGLINAFNDVFAIFSPFLIAYLTYRVSLAVFNAYERVSSEIFKVGVLTEE